MSTQENIGYYFSKLYLCLYFIPYEFAFGSFKSELFCIHSLVSLIISWKIYIQNPAGFIFT